MMKLYLQVLQLSVVNKISVCYILQVCLVLDVTDEWKEEGESGKRESGENEVQMHEMYCSRALCWEILAVELILNAATEREKTWLNKTVFSWEEEIREKERKVYKNTLWKT